jgi:peptidoglycan/xylan/chitin deacetylase (PgdA/CDA1 family)
MSAFARAMVPVLALSVGSWVGLGSPPAWRGFAGGARSGDSRIAVTHKDTSPAMPPLDRPPPSVDSSVIADPGPPWPELNLQDSAERAWLVAEGPAHPPTDGRRLVTFTFDDGPSPDTAALVLRTLEEHRIRASFFFIGEYLEGKDRRAVETHEWAKRIAAAGHYVGNHTFDHRMLTSLPRASALIEIDRAAAAIEDATGKRPLLFRPPYGALDPWLEAALRDRGLQLLLWNIDVQDMKRSDPDEIVRALQEQLEYSQGGIVLLHDVHAPSVKAFAKLVRWLESDKWDPAHPERRGWDIVDLGEYLRATAASPQPYSSRDLLERARRAAIESSHERNRPEPS